MTTTLSTAKVRSEAPPENSQEIVRRLVQDVGNGADWAEALLTAVSLWTAPEEEYNGRHFRYLIGGEAFDWLLLAERICLETDGAIPTSGKEQMLFHGQLPSHITDARFRALLGGPKYRAHLNFWYGVVVEQALQLAVENEARKERRSSGVTGQDDVDDLVHQRIYGATLSDLLREFLQERKQRTIRSMTLADTREFTYWLFKRRLRVCEPARIASDTRKGLLQLWHMYQTSRPHSALS